MEFLKKHYEKILLSLVLLSLGAVALWLAVKIPESKLELEELPGVPPRARAFQPVDLVPAAAALERVNNPPRVILAEGHNVFSPVVWKQKPDGTLIKVETGKELGPDALQITAIRPLHMIVQFDRATPDGFYFRITREVYPAGHRMRIANKYLKPDEKNDPIMLSEVRGEPGQQEFVVQFTDGQVATLSKENPIRKVEAHEADLVYPPEDRKFPNIRVGRSLPMAGEQYKVVAITNANVRVSAPTGKQTTIWWRGAP